MVITLWSWLLHSDLEAMTIEIVYNSDFPVRHVKLSEGSYKRIKMMAIPMAIPMVAYMSIDDSDLDG